MLIMGTRAAAFTAKIRNLHDYQLRLLHGIMPLPSGVDIAATFKYFSQTLLTVLKDVPNSPLELLKSAEKDQLRLSLFPNLDYKGVYNAIVQLVDVAPLIQYGLHVFGQAMLQCLGCLLPFLDNEVIESLPYLTASAMAVMPISLHQEIVNSLCFYILPFTITRRSDKDQENYVSQSVGAVIMMVFQYSENPAHHCQLLECLMTVKKDVVRDLLCVIAYGTAGARSSAAKLLFYYWPTFNPDLFDRRVVLQKFSSDQVPFVCRRDMCPNAGSAEAAKVCFDHCISITFASESPPPLYLCIECANEIHREHHNQMFFDILHPMQQVSMTCENKNCRATDKYAVSICFSTECASYNGNHPIRYCQQCHNLRHNNRRGGDHIIHRSLPPMAEMDMEMQTYLLDSIVSLLKSAKATTPEPGKDLADVQAKASLSNVVGDARLTEASLPNERQQLGRYGVWLLVGLCTPDADTPVDTLGRLLAILFHWFDVTTVPFDEPSDNILERLKMDFVCAWLAGVTNSHFKVFVSCLLPHPPSYARVGGHWDTQVSRTCHLRDGLNRLFSLVPYDVITTEIWDHVMPHWLTSIVRDVPEKEMHEVKILLSKMLDPDLSPLGFDARKLYGFVAVRFDKTSAKVQEQALNWLTVLTQLEIVIPLHLLFAMFGDGVRAMKEVTSDDSPDERQDKSETLEEADFRSDILPVREDDSGNSSALSDDELPKSRETDFDTDAELNLSCCILMCDVLLKQLELQQVDKHEGVHTSLSQDVSRLLKHMLLAAWVGSHSCGRAGGKECLFCESCVMWYQLALELVRFLAPLEPVRPPDVYEEPMFDEGRSSPPESNKKEAKPDVVINMPIPEIHSLGGVLVHMPHIMTATVETVTEQLDLAAIIPAEKVVSAVARAVTLTDTDVATAKVQVARANLVGENDEPVDMDTEGDLDDFWHTSVGRFRFVIDELPQILQFIHQLLTELPSTTEPDILYYSLQCLNIIALHGDAFTKAAKEHRGFFIWSQENLLIKPLWELCNAEHSHISEVCVPLLLHCVTLPAGSDVFWRVIQEEFHNEDWRVRFTAVERVTCIARFMDSTPLKTVLPLQAALANAFCYLVSSMDDSDCHVAQRATLYLGTIHDTAIKALILCLETQFDSIIVDRPMVLQSLYQLHNSLSDRKILSWEFFLNRFDTLFLEAQINLEKSGDITYLRDLRNTDNMSESFVRKVNRANTALSQQTDTASSGSSGGIKTLSASFGHKWPYKRTMSAPAAMNPRVDTKQDSKEKVYNRQFSAPILKRKSSRFGLGQFLGSNPPSSMSNSPPDGQIHAMSATEEGNLVGFLHRVIDLEEADRETMHLLVFLLMQFLSRADQAHPSDEKYMARTQTTVLRHLYLLLGYNHNEKGFHVPPSRLRMSPVFNTFLSNLPQLLDQNHVMGWTLVPTALMLLQYCPCLRQGPLPQMPLYGLWLLEPHSRRCWLMASLVLLYKYNYSSHPLCNQIQSIVRIVLNTLEAQNHVCRRIPATLVMGGASRSRDVSQPSLGGDGDHGDRFETPPMSPLYASAGAGMGVGETVTGRPAKPAAFQRAASAVGGMETHWEEEDAAFDVTARSSGGRDASYSIDADESESELAAIPESPRSDSTIHNSFDDFVNMEESCVPLSVEERGTASAHAKAVGPMFVAESKAVVVESKAVVVESLPTVMTSDSRPSRCEHATALVQSAPVVVESHAMAVACDTRPRVLESHTILKRPDTAPHRPTWLAGALDPARLCQPVAAAACLATAKGRCEPLVLAPAVTAPSTEGLLDPWAERPEPGSPIPRPLRPKPSCPPPAAIAPALVLGNQRVPWQIEHRPSVLPHTPVERLLHIGPGGRNPAVSKPLAQSFRYEDLQQYGSPESPLSKMDVMTIGSPTEMDSETNASSSTCSASQLEFPLPERLLPIGQNEGFTGLVEKVKASIGLSPEPPPPAQRPTELDTRPRLSFIKQDSFERDYQAISPGGGHRSDDGYRVGGASPRRLTKQAALDSSPPTGHGDGEEHSAFYRGVHHERKPPAASASTAASGATQPPREEHAPQRSQRSRGKKCGGLFTIGQHLLSDYPRRPGSWCGPQLQPLLDPATQQACHAQFDLKQSAFRVGDDCVFERCSDCGTTIEEYSDEELGLCITVLGTFIHREPALAAPLLPDILNIVANVALKASYPWQHENNIFLPGGAVSVAHQFLRCVLHQLAPNGIFVQMFQTHIEGGDLARTQFFRSVAQALLDFNELNPTAPLQLVLDNLNARKAMPGGDQLGDILHNMACYLDCLPLEAGLGPGPLLQQLELLFRRVLLCLPMLPHVDPLLRIMVNILKVPGIAAHKGMLDPFSKVLSFSIQNFVMKYHYLVDLCFLCNRSFTREREKLTMSRAVVFELVQALKFKTFVPDTNFLMLINFVLQEAGGSLPPALLVKEHASHLHLDTSLVFNTGAGECMRHHMADALEFLADFHTLGKIKSYCHGASSGLNEDTLGGVLKCGVAQYLALEMNRGNGRDNRAVARFLPWLYNAPTPLQQGPKEFVDCVGHIRLLSWLLLGSLTHVALLSGPGHASCTPIPQEASCHIADHVQVIMAGFAEQSKASVLHMSSLFHAFILCQLWTVYLEQTAANHLAASEPHSVTMSILFDFWGKVTPCILQLVSHSKVLAEMVNLHFLSLLEGLLECNSTLLSKLLPLWSSVLFSYHIQLPGHLQVRLQSCRNFPPSDTPDPGVPGAAGTTGVVGAGNKSIPPPVSKPVLLRWLQRLQFKMGQIEVQSSAATQFYSV